MSDSGGAAPTGCYKCGRPGHWSRDCPSTPSSSSNPNPNSNSVPTSSYPNSTTNTYSKAAFQSKLGANAAPPKPKKVPRIRPKLTPDLLLSDQGLGYILRYFPTNFKYRGRGHEVNDLGNLLRMYAEWHSQLIPYFPFDQFIHKVEEAGSRRVKTCIAELKDRVANGGDPTKLKEPEPENEILNDKEDLNVEDLANHQDDLPFSNDDVDEMHEDIFKEIYTKTAEETSHSTQGNPAVADMPPSNEASNPSEQSPGEASRSPSVSQVTEEQKALMVAKRLKALERAAARSRLLNSS